MELELRISGLSVVGPRAPCFYHGDWPRSPLVSAWHRGPDLVELASDSSIRQG